MTMAKIKSFFYSLHPRAAVSNNYFNDKDFNYSCTKLKTEESRKKLTAKTISLARERKTEKCQWRIIFYVKVNSFHYFVVSEKFFILI